MIKCSLYELLRLSEILVKLLPEVPKPVTIILFPKVNVHLTEYDFLTVLVFL